MAKRKTNSMYSISTAFIHRHYGMCNGEGVMSVNGRSVCNVSVRSDGMRIRYEVTVNGGKIDVDEHVPFEVTPCNYGGGRRWFRCPCCGRRVGVIYMGTCVACRHCFDLIYPSQGDRYKRGWTLYWKLLDRINGVHGMKPKHMHWETFYRLKDKVDMLCARQALPLLRSIERKTRSATI